MIGDCLQGCALVLHGIAGNCENGLIGGTDGVITNVAGIMMRGKKRMIDGQGSMPFAGDSSSYFILHFLRIPNALS